MKDLVAPIAVLDWKSGMTHRVCRSTLAAEASHLANAVEIVDWTAAFVREDLDSKTNLRGWQNEVQKLSRFWATDARSVYDYLTKEGGAASKDKRMAIEGALLKETLRQEGAVLRWVDGSQNIADVLTKLGVDKTYLYKVLREARWTLVQDPVAAEAKRQKAEKRGVRKQVAGAARSEKKLRERRGRAAEVEKLAGEALAESGRTDLHAT